MFGYVRPYKSELLVREYEQYKSVYCELCRELGKSYGWTARFTLSYDCTFYALLSLSLIHISARFLRQSTELARAYLEEDAKSLKRIFDTKSACEVMRPKFLGRENELMAVLLLNGRGQILYCDVLAEGSVSSVPIYKRRLVELCIRYNVQTVFIAHNHPSGLACPSRNDIVATRHIQLSLKGIDAWLSDHIIFAGDDYCSFRSMGLLELIGQSSVSYTHLAFAIEGEYER